MRTKRREKDFKRKSILHRWGKGQLKQNCDLYEYSCSLFSAVNSLCSLIQGLISNTQAKFLSIYAILYVQCTYLLFSCTALHMHQALAVLTAMLMLSPVLLAYIVEIKINSRNLSKHVFVYALQFTFDCPVILSQDS